MAIPTDGNTHVPKRVMVNGKEKIVFARSEETEKAIDIHRLGPFAKYLPLDLPDLSKYIQNPHLIVHAKYDLARRVVRTRLDHVKTPHKVFTGTTLGQAYFANDNYRDGFPIFKQLFLLFGYSESTNRRLHEYITETLFTRYQEDMHVWMIIPKSLEEMAAQWGESLLNLREFAYLRLHSEDTFGPVSSANPTESQAIGGPVPFVRKVVDSSYTTPDELDAPAPIQDDSEEVPGFLQKRDKKKWGK